MPVYRLEVNGIVMASFDRPYQGGPPPGQVDFLLDVTFDSVDFTQVPNVVATTGNPHWTVHPIWVTLNGAGFVVNRKTASPGNQPFTTFFFFMGPGSIRRAAAASPGFTVRECDPETFEALRRENAQA